MLYYDEESFFKEFGNPFNLSYPNIELEVVSTSPIGREMQVNGTTYEEEFIKHIEKNKPDVLIVSRRDLFDKLAEEGKLYNLEAIIEQEKFDLDGYLPGFVDLLRERGAARYTVWRRTFRPRSFSIMPICSESITLNCRATG